MSRAKDTVWERDREGVWQKYCGFLDNSLDAFMGIQEHLLGEQLRLVGQSPLGRRFLPVRLPTTGKEFRETVPLTTYEDYRDVLDGQREEFLAVKPHAWIHTSGRGGTFRWIPYTPMAYERFVDAGAACMILATATEKGEVNLSSGTRVLCNIPRMPYLSGLLGEGLHDRLGLRLIPPIDDLPDTDFHKKTEVAFKMALREGAPIIVSLGSVLVKMGEGMAEHSRKTRFTRDMLHPAVLWRLARAYVRSRLAGRGILPKDLWPARAVIAWGMDTDIFREDIRRYWGHLPYEAYAASEGGILAVQSWLRRGLTLLPYAAYYEFIPENEWLKARGNDSYQPRTVLLPDLEPGKLYEIVISHFYGMPFLRYRLGHFIRVLSRGDDEAGIHLPQVAFHARADDLIDIANFTRIDEGTVHRALRMAGLRYEDWTLRKEKTGNRPSLHLYIEPRQAVAQDGLAHVLHEKLKECDSFYNDLDRMLQIQPVRVTYLRPGTFALYYEQKMRAGVDLANRRPPRMNPLESEVRDLLQVSGCEVKLEVA
ncbi:MAG: GH3 auxin-responsive promoter family protein [Dehalococcoidia bacterium]|nr:GH3 auxin-responsive promoter family protein [Dehalococcoidia bacterium]